MLDSLPDNLIRLILRLASPEMLTRRMYPERQQLLRRVCLVSKRLCALTRPLLDEVVLASSPEGWKAVAKKLKHAKSSSLSLLILRSDKKALFSSLRVVLDNKAALREVRMSVMRIVDLKSLQVLPNLIHLELSSVNLKNDTFCLRNVKELVLLSCLMSSSSSNTLTTDNFPALTSLAYLPINLKSKTLTPISLSPSFLNKLTTLVIRDSVPQSALYGVSSSCRVLMDKFVVDATSFGKVCQDVPYVRAQPIPKDDSAAMLKHVESALKRISNYSQCRLEVLYLPTSLHPSRHSTLDDNAKASFENVRKRCENFDVALEFENAWDFPLSPSFCKYVKQQLKADGDGDDDKPKSEKMDVDIKQEEQAEAGPSGEKEREAKDEQAMDDILASLGVRMEEVETTKEKRV
ncbi:hypothetical protein JCM8547_004917 [Rhodosporidiobolus lusitaniae]